MRMKIFPAGCRETAGIKARRADRLGRGESQQKRPDEAVLADAYADGRAVMTHNRKDFRYLHAANPDHEGIIACSEDLDFVGLADRIHAALEALPNLSGQFIRIVRPPR